MGLFYTCFTWSVGLDYVKQQNLRIVIVLLTFNGTNGYHKHVHFLMEH